MYNLTFQNRDNSKSIHVAADRYEVDRDGDYATVEAYLGGDCVYTVEMGPGKKFDVCFISNQHAVTVNVIRPRKT